MEIHSVSSYKMSSILSSLGVADIVGCLLFLFFFLIAVQFVGVETVTTVLADWRPGFRRYKSVITLGFCIVCYLLGLAHVTQVSGFYNCDYLLKLKTLLKRNPPGNVSLVKLTW